MCFKILLKYKYTYMYRVYKVLTLVNQLLYNIGLFSPTCLSILGKCFKATVSIFSSVHILSSSRTKLQSLERHMTITTPTYRSWKSWSASWAQTLTSPSTETLEGFQTFVNHTDPASHFMRTVYVMRLHIHCKLCLIEGERERERERNANDKFLKTSQNLKVLFPLLSFNKN